MGLLSLKAAYLLVAVVFLFALTSATASAYHLEVRTTVYLPTGNVMRSGDYPYPGAAACDWNVLPMGTRFELGGREYTCLDTGGLVRGYHVDLFAETWAEAVWLQQSVGDYAVITVVEWGQNPVWWRGKQQGDQYLSPGTDCSNCPVTWHAWSEDGYAHWTNTYYPACGCWSGWTLEWP